MTALKLLETVSVEEYLEGEKLSPVKHEYVDGRVFALAGATDAHNRIAGNIYAQLWDAAGRKSCRLYMSDMKLRVLGKRYYYPDVMAVCDDADDDLPGRGLGELELLERPAARAFGHDRGGDLHLRRARSCASRSCSSGFMP